MGDVGCRRSRGWGRNEPFGAGGGMYRLVWGRERERKGAPDGGPRCRLLNLENGDVACHLASHVQCMSPRRNAMSKLGNLPCKSPFLGLC